jgi:hypothetical protein
MPTFWRKLIHSSYGWKSESVSRPVMKVTDTAKSGKEKFHVAIQMTQTFSVTVCNIPALLA